jgi:hypothetical protein
MAEHPCKDCQLHVLMEYRLKQAELRQTSHDERIDTVASGLVDVAGAVEVLRMGQLSRANEIKLWVAMIGAAAAVVVSALQIYGG